MGRHKLLVKIIIVCIVSFIFSEYGTASKKPIYSISKTEASLYLDSICSSSNSVDSIKLYYLGFSMETVYCITRRIFLEESYDGFKDKPTIISSLILLNEFKSLLKKLKYDTIMPYDTKHINSRIRVEKDGKAMSCEESSSDLRCMALLYVGKKVEIIWFSRVYVYIGSWRFDISEKLKNFIDILCEKKIKE